MSTSQTNNYNNLIYEEKSGEDQGIAVLTFNRPKVLNALNMDLMQEFSKALDHVQKNKNIRVLILTGAGEKAFVAGADISQFPHMTTKDAIQFATFGQGVFNKLESLDAVVIAAVNGFALGGGCELVAACDFIYASTAAKFGQPEVNLGIIPGYGGTQRFVRLVGKARGKELVYTGRIIDAQEAYRIGLVNKVCLPPDLMKEVLSTAKTIVAKAPIAVAQAKHAIDDGYNKELADALELECDAFAKTFETSDQKEGALAFLEKRPPKFVGK